MSESVIEVNGQEVWRNGGTPGGGAENTIDRSWTLHELDISALADDRPAVAVRFRLKSDGGIEFGGWTLDDFSLVTVADGTRPPLVASSSFASAYAPSRSSVVAIRTRMRSRRHA